MWRRLNTCLTVAENICGALAAIGLGAIMLIVASDVGLRYGLGRPWPWAYDVVSIYLTVAVFYLALARTLREHGHINVDLARARMGLRTKHALDLLTSILAAVFFSLLAMLTLTLAESQYLGAEVISSYMDWPTWLSTVFVPIGTILTVLRLGLNAVSHANVVVTGREPTWFAKLEQPSDTISTGE
jgi:TRAP-type C4-dicarboxylate transport system permease small subunit